jgi:hypothetical protein
MRKIIYILTFLVFTGCGESNSEKKNADVSVTAKTDSTENLGIKKDDTLKLDNRKDSIIEESNYNPEEYRRESLNLSFEKATLFNLTDTISADFNGDGIIDKAVYVKENETSGIIIMHGKINEEVRIGFGKQFAHMTEFDWVDYWGLVMDKETSETTFTEDGDILGSEDVKLQNPSIALGKDEVGGGLITFMNGKYVWIHQTC